MIRRTLAAILVLSLVVGASGCSRLFMTPPPDPPIQTPPRCTSSRIPPVIDLVIGVPYLTAGVLLLAIGASARNDQGGILVGLGVGVTVFGGLFTWSGFKGLNMARECDEAEAQFEEYVANGRYPGPGTVTNPWNRADNPWRRPPPAAPPPRPGTEGAICAPGGACDPGLTCASGFCVRLPP